MSKVLVTFVSESWRYSLVIDLSKQYYYDHSPYSVSGLFQVIALLLLASSNGFDAFCSGIRADLISS